MRIGIPRTSDFWVIQRLTKLLTRRERLVIFLTLGVRLALVVLDIVGLALVGVSVSLVSGTAISSKSVTGAAVSWLSHSGFQYPYAFFGFASVFFFVAKTLLAIQLNNFVLGRVARVEARKSLQLFEQIADSNLDKLDQFSKPQLNTALNEGFELSVTKLVMGISTVFGEFVLVTGVGIYLAFIEFRLFAIMAVFFLCLAWLMQKLVSSRTKNASLKLQKSSIKTQTVISDFYQNFRQLKSHGRSSLLVERFAASRESQAQESAKLSALSVMPRYITEIALMLGFSLLLLQRSIAGADAFSATTLGIFIAGAFRILASLLPLQGSLTMLKQISGSSLLALELIDTFGSPTPTRSAQGEPNPPLDISIKKLSFSYPGKGRPLLKEVSLEIPFGSYLAIIGKSGSGKSSLADLILGLRAPSSGSVTIGGIPATDFIRVHSGVIAYVPQKNHLLTGTLAQNVSLSESTSSIDLDLVARSLEQSGLGDLQSSLPDGLDTMFGEGLRELSGGQAQRLGIARAIYQNARVIIFDEATSALDSNTELEVLQTIETMIGSRTIIAIAHRGAVMDHANTRVLLEAGQIKLSQTAR